MANQLGHSMFLLGELRLKHFTAGFFLGMTSYEPQDSRIALGNVCI